MHPIKRENSTEAVLVLETLRRKLQHRYNEASKRQSQGGRPSGHMNGLNEAIKEVDNLLLESSRWRIPAPRTEFSLMESQAYIGNGVTLQVWFTRSGPDNIRSDVYCFEDGSVVAYQDCINGVNEPLYVESIFKAMYEDEPAFSTILHYAGVIDASKVQLYYMGR